jgi:hypothetical protein
MSEITDLRQVQRRIAQLTTFEDGLWDLLLGFIFLLLAVYPVTRELLGPEWNIILFLSLLALMVGAWFLVRYLVSIPRIGYVRSRRSPKLRLLVAITILLVLLTFGLVALTFFSPMLDGTSSTPIKPPSGRNYLVEIIVVFALGALFSAMGYLLGVRRIYFYGWMVGLANLASVYMSHNAGWTFMIPLAIAAVIILIIGFALLVRFLGRYARRDEGS